MTILIPLTLAPLFAGIAAVYFWRAANLAQRRGFPNPDLRVACVALGFSTLAMLWRLAFELHNQGLL